MKHDATPDDVLAFGACAGLDGRVRPVDFYRQNGQRRVIVPRDCCGPAEDHLSGEAVRLPNLFANLTQIEQRTWLKLLTNRSVAAIAKEEGVTRTAIYERIRGNARGTSGMVAKNPWIAVWWARRQSEHP